MSSRRIPKGEGLVRLGPSSVLPLVAVIGGCQSNNASGGRAAKFRVDLFPTTPTEPDVAFQPVLEAKSRDVERDRDQTDEWIDHPRRCIEPGHRLEAFPLVQPLDRDVDEYER